MKRFFVIAAFGLALPAAAQDFGPPPMQDAGAVHACIADQVAEGHDALVSRAARDCIGRTLEECTRAALDCAEAEQRYWGWRIARTYAGLQAWVADSDTVADAVAQSVANPAAATVNVPLECQLRVTAGQGGDADPFDMANCMMRETALIALELEFSVRQACDTAREGAFAVYCGRE